MGDAPIHNAADLRKNERRRCIAWLHARAQEMNDPHARGILNSAAFALGVTIRRDAPVASLPAPDERWLAGGR